MAGAVRQPAVHRIADAFREGRNQARKRNHGGMPREYNAPYSSAHDPRVPTRNRSRVDMRLLSAEDRRLCIFGDICPLAWIIWIAGPACRRRGIERALRKTTPVSPHRPAEALRIAAVAQAVNPNKRPTPVLTG
jgi:hypothetical protein